MTDFYKAAQAMFAEHNWVSQPLTLDASGRPKVPIVKGWRQLRSPEGLPWEEAKGIGIVLGQASDNLAAIDVDDVELSNAIFALMVRTHVATRMVRTGRGRMHLYFREQHPSASTSFKASWRGSDRPIELRAEGNQITAPPTSGYEPMGIEGHLDDIKAVPSLRAAWEPIAAKLGIEMPATTTRPSAGYPTPWQAEVPAGERNRSMYVEAHKLRQADVPLDEALALLQGRYETSYEPGESDWQEMANTIISAYSKADVIEGRIEWALS